MIVVTSKVGGQLCMVAALLLLGTWPALFNLLERRGRKPQHTYLDYTFANFTVALIVAFTLGQLGKPPTFTEQLNAINDNWPAVFFAVLGGLFLCMGNMGTQYSLAYCGLSITEVVASSLTVVGGTIINFFLDGQINRAEILFPGVACFLVAAVTGMFLHASNLDDIKRKLGIANGSWLSNLGSKETTMELDSKLQQQLPTVDGKPYTTAASGDTKTKKGSAAHLENVEKSRSIKTGGAGILTGLFLLMFTGASYILFSPAFNLATNDQFHVLRNGTHKLVVYTAFFWFSLTFFVVSLVTNIAFMYKPVLGAPTSSVQEWLGDWDGRLWAIAAGLICGIGNSLQFMGGQAAGYAAADSVQALPLVSTFWGVVLFGEYLRSSKRTYYLLAIMLAMFVAAVGLLMGSAGQRDH